jgi:hypothetical protein
VRAVSGGSSSAHAGRDMDARPRRAQTREGVQEALAEGEGDHLAVLPSDREPQCGAQLLDPGGARVPGTEGPHAEGRRPPGGLRIGAQAQHLDERVGEGAAQQVPQCLGDLGAGGVVQARRLRRI